MGVPLNHHPFIDGISHRETIVFGVPLMTMESPRCWPTGTFLQLLQDSQPQRLQAAVQRWIRLQNSKI